MFKKLVCFTGWLVVVCLSLVFCFIFGLWQHWSTPVILLFWLLMLFLTPLLWGTLYGLIRLFRGKKGLRLLKKYHLSRREFVLLSHWKVGADILRRLRRKRTRLPWYVMVGDRCGKSTLLASSGVPRFYGVTDDTVVGPTRTLNWWFFRRLCVLDLSSNFLHGTAAFRQTWGKVAFWINRMPAPAGVIIALPIGILMNGQPGVLHEAARRQRALIEPLMRRFRERLPLYIMVTECDRFPGFSLWQQQLSARQKQQALGYTWVTPPHIDGQDEHTLAPLFSVLKQGFSRVRLSMARPEQISTQDYVTLLDFPEAFSNLEPALRSFLSSLCEPNAYFSRSTLRSVWFTATEPLTENRKRRISYFVHELLTGHLWDLAREKEGHRWYQRRRGKTCCILLLTAGLLWTGVSATLSAGRLQPEISRMSSGELAEFMATDEQYSPAALRYLPFLPLLNKQYSQAISRLVQVKDTPRPAQQTLADYQQRVLSASPSSQRDYILQLAEALYIWQQMRDGASLRTLQHLPPVAASLQQRLYPAELPPLAQLALERYHMQGSGGQHWMRSAQQLLVKLVNHDPSMTWLLSDSETLPSLQATGFWPLLPETVALSGVWSRQGEIAVNKWMSLIEQTAGQPQPVFRQLRDSWSARRQAAWRQYLIEVTAALSSQPQSSSMTKSQIIALGQNNSPSMQFIEKTISELSTVSAPQTENWLMTLRNVHQLSVKGNASAMISRAKLADARIRQSLLTWLQGKQSERSAGVVTEPAVRLWENWQKARNLAVKEAVAQGEPSPFLTRGLFASPIASPTPASERNPLLDLLPALSSLQERLSPANQDVGIAAIWLLYKNDARQLLMNAMSQSACWLNGQWKSRIIWPLESNAGNKSYDEQQALSLTYISEFMRGPAKALLVTDTNGPEAGSYAGLRVPLTDDFIRFTRHSFPLEIIQDVPQRVSTRDGDRRAALQAKLSELELQQSELEKQVWSLSLSSMPATIPGGAKVIPVGTQLTLKCQKGEQQLDSINFAEKAEFTWQAGQCQEVALRVKFPGFTVSYHHYGENAWPDFVQRFASGETLFDSGDFGADAALLNNLGIQKILVRFAVSETQPLNDAWISWRDRAEQIGELRTQLADLDARIQRQQSDISLANPLSALPENIAHCQ
ncbi:type VI secretion protein IcmF/TssM N-terminal domain-containing protein [Enterobacter mori]|uniref:type VI secretion protein IcmF/TssM N-terminal domain-containing protein n=1 Tax=Enterobacter mori TaxID=539813 RepID=UPI003B83A5F0